MSNLPPGITESMIPGNRPEDAAFEFWCNEYGAIYDGGTMDVQVADAILERSGVVDEKKLAWIHALPESLRQPNAMDFDGMPQDHIAWGKAWTDYYQERNRRREAGQLPDAHDEAILKVRSALIASLREIDGGELAELAVKVDVAPAFDSWYAGQREEQD